MKYGLWVKREERIVKMIAMFSMVGLCVGTLRADEVKAVSMNPILVSMESNKWIKLHEQKQGDKVRFRMQEHGGSCFDTKRCRFVLFGSNTHGKDWTNTPLIFDVVAGEWSSVYPSDSKETYTTNAAGLPVAGPNGDHPWAMHTFGTMNYDPDRDEMVVAIADTHMVPGRFTDALKGIWGKVKRHPTWTFHFSDNTWAPLECEAVNFFPYCSAWDSDRKVVVGYGGPGIWELGGEPRTWKKIEGKSLMGWHDNAVYDSRNKAVVVFGSHENSNDIVIYRPSNGEHKKMPTPGDRPPKDQHNPMCFDPVSGRTVVLVDHILDAETRKAQAETWLYDLATDSWKQMKTATLPFALGMNYCMEYDPRHNVCLLMAQAPAGNSTAITMFALKVEGAYCDRESLDAALERYYGRDCR